MGCTLEERKVVIDRLKKNISSLLEVTLYLDKDEKKLVAMYLYLALNYGLDKCVENAYTFNADGFVKHDVGTKNEVNVKNTLDSLAIKPERSVLIVHNHLDSILPSDDDTNTFFQRHILKSTTVCGNIGNLYFMQKGTKFHELIKHEVLAEIRDKVQKMFSNKTQKYLRERGETPKGLLAQPESVRNECFRSVTDIVYCDICRMIQCYDDGFQFYSEGVALSGE